jgi:hypothetical protein
MGDKKRISKGRTGGSPGEAAVKEGRRFAKMAQRPLKKQNSSDAWNERANRVSSSRDAAKLLMKGTMEKNKAKAKGKK